MTLRAVVVGAFFSALFAGLTVYLTNRRAMVVTANQIPVLPYVLLIVSVVLVNPLCRLVRIVRRFSPAEILIIFLMGMVSSGVSTFGMTSQVIPVIGSLFNRHWNNEQTEWDRYVQPFLNESFFLSEPGIQAASQAYREALSRPAEPEAGKTSGAAERAALRELEKPAFEKVDTFRRGLPRGLRAFPGFVPVAGEDDTETYGSRFRRLGCGRRAAGHIRDALDALNSLPQAGRLSPKSAGHVAGLLQHAADALAPAGVSLSVEAKVQDLNERDNNLAEQIMALTSDLARLSDRKRQGSVQTAELEKRIKQIAKQKESLTSERNRLAAAKERKLSLLHAAGRAADAADELRTLQERIARDSGITAAGAAEQLTAVLLTFPYFDGTLRRYLVGDVPWSDWLKPLFCWGVVIGLSYIILMTFNVLIFRQWAYNEKLVYPLARVPEMLAGSDSGGDGLMPEVFRNGLFWLALAISGGVMGWNLLCATGVLPGLKALELGIGWKAYVQHTTLEGLAKTSSPVFFTMIGLAFLIPQKVSFSLWFFHVLFLVELLAMVWMGYGQNMDSFPSEWWYTLNFRTAQGGGALLVFASVVLFKCRKYLVCAFSPSAVKDLVRDEQRELRISSALFFLATFGLLLMLCCGMGVNVYYAVLTYVIIMVITVGLIRAVTEGGLLGFQAWCTPFHVIRHVFGFDKTWTAPHFVAPLMVFYSILFLDIKTFIAPAMANGLKIRDDLKLARGKFHAVVLLAVSLAAVVAIVTAIILCYASGADAMERWFYTSFPKGLLGHLAEMSKVPPTATSSGRLWLAFGALLMAALLFFRQRAFWVPHPIGLIMLVNPIMRQYWFSMLLGWIAKALVTKYGNKDTYAKTRGFFVGLIAGELIIVALAMVVSIVMQKNMGITLNR